jgi:hypothetical protein
VPVVDVERLGAASVVFMSMLCNHISWYNSRMGRGTEYESLAPSPAVLGRGILGPRECQQATPQGF